MPKDQANKPPTFLSAISTILLGIFITTFGVVFTIFINYFAFISAGLGIVILYVGRIQWKQFQATLPEYDLDNTEHSFGNSIEQKFYNHVLKNSPPRVREWFKKGDKFYEEETLAEKRP